MISSKPCGRHSTEAALLDQGQRGWITLFCETVKVFGWLVGLAFACCTFPNCSSRLMLCNLNTLWVKTITWILLANLQFRQGPVGTVYLGSTWPRLGQLEEWSWRHLQDLSGTGLLIDEEKTRAVEAPRHFSLCVTFPRGLSDTGTSGLRTCQPSTLKSCAPRELAGRKLHLLRCFTRSIPPNSIYSKQVPICVQGEETRIHLLMGEASKMCGRVLESLPSCIYILGYPSLTDTDRHWCKYGCLTLSFYVGVGQLE